MGKSPCPHCGQPDALDPRLRGGDEFPPVIPANSLVPPAKDPVIPRIPSHAAHTPVIPAKAGIQGARYSKPRGARPATTPWAYDPTDPVIGSTIPVM